MSLIDKLKKKFDEVFPNENEPQKKYFQDNNEMLDVLMQDGTVEQYPVGFHISDGINGAMCKGFDNYHTHLDCPYFKNERAHNRIIAVYRKEAEKQGIFQCFKCQEWDKLEEADE